MRTELETIAGYLAGRENAASERIRHAMADPKSRPRQFVDELQRRTRALPIAERIERTSRASNPNGPVKPKTPAPRGPTGSAKTHPGPRSLRIHPRQQGPALVAALVVLGIGALLIGLGWRDQSLRLQRIEQALALRELQGNLKTKTGPSVTDPDDGPPVDPETIDTSNSEAEAARVEGEPSVPPDDRERLERLDRLAYRLELVASAIELAESSQNKDSDRDPILRDLPRALEQLRADVERLTEAAELEAEVAHDDRQRIQAAQSMTARRRDEQLAQIYDLLTRIERLVKMLVLRTPSFIVPAPGEIGPTPPLPVPPDGAP